MTKPAWTMARPRRPRSSHRSAALAAGACAVLLGACTTTLEPTLPVAQPTIAAQFPGAGTTAGMAVADIGWRDFFTDARLAELIASALDNNRDQRIALLNIERAQAVFGVQSSERYPGVNASGGLTRQRAGAVTSTYSASIGVAAWELDLFGRIRSLSEASQRQILAQAQAQRSVQISLIAEIAATWLSLAADQEQQALSQATVRNLEAAHQLMARRFQLGAASALELNQARTLLETARADAARYAGLIAADRNALTLLVGRPLDAARLPADFTGSISGVAALPAELPSTVLLRRPDVAQAEFQLRAANASIGAARAAFFPTITLTGNAGVASRDLGDLFQSGSVTWSFIPQIRLPIFQGDRLQANLGITTADRDIALARYEKAIQSGFREIADALANSSAITERKAALQAVLDAAQRAQALSELRYNAGRDPYNVLLDAQRTLYAARQNLVTIRLAEQANRVTLYKALGGGWRERTS